MRVGEVADGARKPSISRLRATIAPGPAQDDERSAPPARRTRRSGAGAGSSDTAVPGRPASACPRPKLVEQRAPDLEQVADDVQVREVGHRRIRVAVDGDDRLGGLHPDLVLDGPADAQGQVQLRLDDLAGLADLLAVGDPAASRPRRAVAPTAPPSSSARSCSRANPSAPPTPRPPDTMIRASSIDTAAPCASTCSTTLDLCDARGRPACHRSRRSPGAERTRRRHVFGRTVMMPRALVKAASVTSLPPKTLCVRYGAVVPADAGRVRQDAPSRSAPTGLRRGRGRRAGREHHQVGALRIEVRDRCGDLGRGPAIGERGVGEDRRQERGQSLGRRLGLRGGDQSGDRTGRRRRRAGARASRPRSRAW